MWFEFLTYICLCKHWRSGTLTCLTECIANSVYEAMTYYRYLAEHVTKIMKHHTEY